MEEKAIVMKEKGETGSEYIETELSTLYKTFKIDYIFSWHSWIIFYGKVLWNSDRMHKNASFVNVWVTQCVFLCVCVSAFASMWTIVQCECHFYF